MEYTFDRPLTTSGAYGADRLTGCGGGSTVSPEPRRTTYKSRANPAPEALLVDRPAYERDPTLTRLETTVSGSGERDGRPFVVLDDTVLYPEGGGQPADHGLVAGVPVTDVQKVDGGFMHALAGAVDAERVEVELDWTRRFDHMQQHTAQHLLTAIAADRFGWGTTAFHLGARVSDIELDVPALSSSDLHTLEEAVAAEVRAARPVRARRVARAEYEHLAVRSRGLPEGHTGDVRLVEIDGVDLNTCGGTHCASTAELEAVKLLGTESLRGGTRLFYVAGGRLRRRLATEVSRTAELRTRLGVSDDEIVSAVDVKLEQVKERARTMRRMEDELAALVADSLVAEGGGVSVAHHPERDLAFLQRVARVVEERDPARTVFLTAGEGEEGFFLLAGGEASGLDVAEMGAAIADVLDGRGGGRGRVFQGRAGSISKRGEAASLLRGS